MKGKTVVARSVPPVRPLSATAPPYCVVRSAYAVAAPPTGSTTAAQRCFSIGRSDSAEVSSRESTSDTPSSRRNSASSALPVAAWTSYPRAARIPTAIEPTPPVAPRTRTGRSALSGDSPCSSRRTTDSAAVNPAVPSAMASRALRPSGSGITQSAGTRATSA